MWTDALLRIGEEYGGNEYGGNEYGGLPVTVAHLIE